MTVIIGSQSDVPGPGDPIVSPWYQDTARKIVHVFSSTASRDNWTNPPDGAVCEAPAGVWWTRVGGVWVRGSDGTQVRAFFEDRSAAWTSNPIPNGSPAVVAQLSAVPIYAYHLYELWGSFGVEHNNASGAAGAYCRWRNVTTAAVLGGTVQYIHAPSVMYPVSVRTMFGTTVSGTWTFELSVQADWWSAPVLLTRDPANAPWLANIIDHGAQ